MERRDYPRRHDQVTSGRHEDWTDEQDEWLREQCKTSITYTELASAYANRFSQSKSRSRNSILGRAMRKGYRDHKPNGHAHTTSVARNGKPKSGGGRQVAVRKSLAPVTFKDPSLLRDDREPLIRRASPHTVRKTPEQIAGARRGVMVSIIEEQPLTSKPLFETDADACKWPTSEDIRCMEVCGEPATHGAYCERHARVAYSQMPTKKRNHAFSRRGMLDDTERRRNLQGASDGDVRDDGDAPLSLPHFIANNGNES